MQKKLRDIGTFGIHLRWLLHAQPCRRSGLVQSRQPDAHDTGIGIQLKGIESPCIQGQPQADWGHKNSLPGRVAWGERDHSISRFHVYSKRYPSVFGMIYEVRTRIPGVPKEIRTVIPAVWIGL